MIKTLDILQSIRVYLLYKAKHKEKKQMTNEWKLARLKGPNSPAHYVLFYDESTLDDAWYADTIVDKNGYLPTGGFLEDEVEETGLDKETHIKKDALKHGIWCQSADDANDWIGCDLKLSDLDGVAIL